MNDSDFALQSSADPHQIFAAAGTHHLLLHHHRRHRDPGNPRKKRSKLIRIDDAAAAGTAPSSSRTISKPKYSRKPDPAAPKITRPCSECGKTFWSWKALFGHMRCHPERHWRGINPPPNHRRDPPLPELPFPDLEATMTEEDHEVAAALLMLANGGISAASMSRSFQEAINQAAEEEEDERNSVSDADSGGGGGFECSSCKKVFGSHQALGGHRASHKNVKGCFAITRSTDSEMDQDLQQQIQIGGGDKGLVTVLKDSTANRGGAVVDEKMVMLYGHSHSHSHGHSHRCSICLRVFSSGQALGGHKRCHWDTTPLNHGLMSSASEGHCGLDLNLPAPVDQDDTVTSTSTASYTSGLTLDLRLGL